MSNISSNSLFHFTTKREYLINILKQTFKPRYSIEEIRLFSSQISKVGIPMTCFCDISLSQINDHIDMYGSYGIGMTKEWGMKNKLNPVIYVNPNSYFSESIYALADNVNISLTDHCSEATQSIFDNYMNIHNYIKPYIGDFNRGKKIFKNVKFYNEREWRFVPQIDFCSEVKNTLKIEQFEDANILEKENQNLGQFGLKFQPKDIKYIFVKDEVEIPHMMQELRVIKQRFSSEEIDILTSKILTTNQVKEDF